MHAIGEPPEEHRAFFEARRNQLVFSVKGASQRGLADLPKSSSDTGVRPLASELGGGDLDGDPFGICTYEPLYPKEPADPAEYPPTIPAKLDRPAEWSDVVQWVTTYIGSCVAPPFCE